MWAIGDTVSFLATFRERDNTPASGLSVETISSAAYDRTGTEITFPSLSSWSEIGSTGQYRATADVTDAGIYHVIAGVPDSIYLDYECEPAFVETVAQRDPLAASVSGYDPGTLAGVLDALDLGPITTTLDDLTTAATSFEAALLLLGSRKVNIVSPIAKDLTLTIYQGDDYDVASDRGISWTFGAEPDLTDAEVTLTISAYRTIRTGSQRIVTKQYITPLTATCTLSGEGTSAQIVTAELTSEQTATLEAGLVGHYDIAAVLASTNDVTLQRGRVKIIPEITA